MRQTRIVRLLQLIGLLQAGRNHNVNSLAQESGVSRRQVFRDLKLLQEAGLPLIFDQETGCYQFRGKSYLPPTNFTAEEALAVIVLCHEMGEKRGVPFLTPARAAATKLESSLPLKLREQLRKLTNAIQIRFPPGTEQTEQGPIYQVLVEAIGECRAVRIYYDSFSEHKDLVTKLNPYRLLYSRHSWYVIGRSSMHAETRTFNVARIRKLEMTSDRFRMPKHFRLEQYLGNAWHLIPESGKDQLVHVRFMPPVARNVAEVTWHPTQRCEFNPDGSLEFQVTVSGLSEICWWILGYGFHAEVLKPKALRERVADMTAKMAQLYRDPA
ncbi:MAG TPA: WYL domain-containing protein [Pirellulales bacterium]|jgi:proteasome accessory factor B|nr:WYL domain-containing protein [Pirellulales bacterium]